MEDYTVADLLNLRRAAPDLFYRTLTSLTNSQLRGLCQRDKKNQFCDNLEFWQKLWREKFQVEPPAISLLLLRRNYEEANLLDSLVEDIYQDSELAYQLQKNVRAIDWNEEHKEDDYEDLDQFAAEEEVYINDEFKKMSRDQIKRILTISSAQKMAEEEGQIEIPRRGDEKLHYADPIVRTALQRDNPDLLRYYFLVTPEIVLYITGIIQEYENKSKFVNEVLTSLEPLARLPFIRNSHLYLLYQFCKPKIIRAFFDSNREDKIKELSMMFNTSFLKPNLEKCPNTTAALAEGIRNMGKEAYPVKETLERWYNPFLDQVLIAEDIEPLLMETMRNNIRIKLLSDWDVDRVGLLRELMEKKNWYAFQNILRAIVSLSEDYDEKYQKELWELFRDFHEGRLDRFSKRNLIWDGSNIVEGELLMETLLLEALRGKYFLKGLKLALSSTNNPLRYLPNIKNKFRELNKKDREELYTSLKNKRSMLYELKDILGD